LAFGSRMALRRYEQTDRQTDRQTNQDHGLRAASLLELVGGEHPWTRAVRLLVISTPLYHIRR
jgi:hypothetical protein